MELKEGTIVESLVDDGKVQKGLLGVVKKQET
eukprot:CAMPEP_0178847654 /NCGR_PEP_ID=MMETSP0746-20121128/18796_1 /TAXON_ID=913974 /ORGANISM="Nitzschia punctata, Strain CCMP561" /LENGTH=31 /DNA_ID= /DNA_START= /DNA_END= /DNA_ORIENTATION=